MARPQFSIGIDLGTTNCAMAFAAFDTATPQSELFLISQWETLSEFSEAPTMPSFLYLLSENEIQQMAGESTRRAEWIAGRMARKRAAGSPGRVVHSAKSWLCHHAVDRSEPFLPWRSDEIPVDKRISPIRASALLLEHLRGAWNAKFAAEGFPFEDQDITVTVPASFDAAAQRLTLDAAHEAGFPAEIRLLEEPQAAFYRWLEHGDSQGDLWKKHPDSGPHHVVVIDVGGGTTDLTLFAITPRSGTSIPHIKRIAVSDHLLLGGDNIDLAIAHRIESRLGHESLSSAQWNFLVALCRDVKERCLSNPSDDAFPVSIPGRGSSLLSGTITGLIKRTEVESIVLEGFFPECGADDRPARTQAGLREWALPYAADSAITRYLAEFLHGRPPVDAILFNGGSLYPERLRQRLQKQIAGWQHGVEPRILHNPEPSLAVARGAARFGSIVQRRAERIEAGAARSIYLEVHKGGAKHDERSDPTLICILPNGAASEENFRVSEGGLELRVNRLVRFQPYYSTRRGQDKAGFTVPWNDRDFHPLPPLQTTARFTGLPPEGGKLPVILNARINDLGLLHVACISTNPRFRETWPLEFNLRPHESRNEKQNDSGDDVAAQTSPRVDQERLDAAKARITTLFSRPLDGRDKLTATNLLKSLERILSMPKGNWNYVLIRLLWPTLEECFSHRQESIEHEESWLILAGFLLRPGFGVESDAARINELWRLHAEGVAYPGKRIQLQLYILWRRVAGGLSRERQEAILAPELPKLRSQKNPSAELVRLAGSLERINSVTKVELVNLFLRTVSELAANKLYCAPYLAALGLLLNRTPLYAGLENVIPATHVEQAYEALSDLDWSEPELAEIQTLFLRAGRIVDSPDVDLPARLREKIVSKLQKSGVAPSRIGRLRTFVPIAQADRASFFGESLPPGLVIAGD
jgi:molecular chaperone DnaK (HSP70)